MTHSRLALGIACALVLILQASSLPPLVAQEDPRNPRVRVEGERPHAYALKHVSPPHAQEMLRGLIDGRVRMVADDRTGNLLVVASDRLHQQIADLIAMFDLPAAQPAEGEQKEVTRVFTLKHRSIESILVALSELQPILVSAIKATNSLIARGTPEELADLESVIGTLDIESAGIELECWILAHGGDHRIIDDPTLAPLERELAKTGLDGYAIFSHMTVRGISGEKFRTSQTFDERRVRNTMLSGKVHLSSGENARLAFDLKATLGLEESDPDDRSPPVGTFSLSTELKTQIGKLVVVGLAPTGNEASKPLVLVLRVSR